MDSRLKTGVLIMVVLLTSFSICFGQHRVKTFDISKKITALQSSDDGYLLYGTENGEVGIYDGLQFVKRFDLGASINKILISGPTTNYLTSRGVYSSSYDNDPLLISPNNLSVLDMTPDGKQLITTSGIYLLSDNEYIADRNDFYDISLINKGSFFSLDKTDYIHIDDKIYEYGKSWQPIVFHPQSDYSVIKWNSKNFIISDSKGIVRFDKELIVDTLIVTDSILLSQVFKIGDSEILYCADDMISVFNLRKKELNELHTIKTDLIKTATVDRWDNVWLSAGSYLYQILDTQNDKSNAPPEVRIYDIQLNGENVSFSEDIKLRTGNNDLEIRFQGVHLSKPQELEYQTKLTKIGGDRYTQSSLVLGEWSSPSNIKEVEYRNLPAGKYKFELRASIDGKYYTYADHIKVRVEDDMLQWIWLIGLFSALAILLSAIFFNNRYNRLKLQSDQERKILLQKNKMLTLQQKALQLQMNPHFIFNALNSIQGLIAKEDNRSARRYLQQFSSMMRSMLNQSREEYIKLEDEIQYLKSYLSLERMANNDSFDYRISTMDDVEEGVRIPNMLIQPFVENSILHGVKGLSDRKGIIEIIIDQEGSTLLCTIKDNGRGRIESAKLKKSNHKSIALDVVTERLSQKEKNSFTAVKYTDLKDHGGNAVGTEVLISIPII